METIKKTITNLTAESVSILTQQFNVELVTETKLEMQTQKQKQTQIELQKKIKTETQLQDGKEVEVEVEVEVPVEVEVEVDVEVPVETEVEVEKETQIGSNHRCAYSNTESGRLLLINSEPEDIVSEVLTVWGDEPTVEDIDMSEYQPEPTAKERITQLEEQVALQTENEAELLYQISLMQLGLTDDEM